MDVLEQNQIHIYKIKLGTEPLAHEKENILSTDERERAERFKFPIHRQRFITCHSALREILGKLLNLPPAEIQFSCNKYGKPSLKNLTDQKRLSFNLSHSEEMAVVGCAWDTEIGIDIEKIKPIDNVADLTKRYFSENESNQFTQAENNEKMRVFFNGWTAKEAFIKAHGKGLSMDLKSFEVDIGNHHQPKLLYVKWDPAESDRWSFYRFEPQKDSLATLVYRGKNYQIEEYNWNPISE